MPPKPNDPAVVRLENVRLSFPHLFTAHAMKADQEAKYSAAFIMDNDQLGICCPGAHHIGGNRLGDILNQLSPVGANASPVDSLDVPEERDFLAGNLWLGVCQFPPGREFD